MDSQFVQHLSENNLKTEYFTYLNNARGSEDTLAYHFTKYHFKFGKDEDVIANANRSKLVLRNDPKLLLHYSVAFLNPLEHNTDDWYSTVLDTSLLVTNELKQLSLVYCLTANPVENPNLPEQLMGDYELYRKSMRKKPIVAGICSAVIPGLGLMYLNKPRAFASSFFMIGGFGFQTYEAYHNFGLKHPLTIINGAFFTGFYLVNIIGSYLEVKKHQKELKNQYLIHASTYYSATYRTKLF